MPTDRKQSHNTCETKLHKHVVSLIKGMLILVQLKFDGQQILSDHNSSNGREVKGK